MQRSGVWEKTTDDHVVAKFCDFVGVFDSLDSARDIRASRILRGCLLERDHGIYYKADDHLYVSESYDIRFNLDLP